MDGHRFRHKDLIDVFGTESIVSDCLARKNATSQKSIFAD
jgi:hypothetical protein